MNTAVRRRVWTALHIAAILAMLCFIFGNSLLDGSQSSEISSGVAEAVEPVVRPVAETITAAPLSDEAYHGIVRKMAHFCEFAALAALAAALPLRLCGTWRSHTMAYVLFGTLLAAVTDEFIQSFTGRTSSVRDVLIDFSGALCGMLFAIVLHAVIRALRRPRT